MKRTIVKVTIFLMVFPLAYIGVPIDVWAMPVDCMCVAYLNQYLGVNIHGDADTIRANIPFEYVVPGDVLLFRYPGVSHVALITAIHSVDGQTVFDVSESNFHHCKPDSRAVYADDPAIRGAYRPPVLSTPLVSLGL